jgi:transcriptional regulator with XRE-family HTH domain
VATLLGRRLRALRKMRKLTQERLGERARLSGKFVGEIERGIANPSLEVLARLSGALGVSLFELVNFEEAAPRGPVSHAVRGFAAAEQLVRYLVGKSPAEIERVLRVVEAMFGNGSGSGAGGKGKQ